MRNRRDAERRGRLAEWIAIGWLMAKGYRILGHRVRTPFGEVDVAALNRGVFVIVEVKARATLSAGLDSVGHAGRRRIASAAAGLAARWRLGALPMRFDIVVIRPGRLPHHERDAWRMDEGLTMGQR